MECQTGIMAFMDSLPTGDDIAAAETRMGVQLPDDYKTFLLRENGRDWETDSAYVRLYTLDDVLASFDVAEQYQRQLHPGLIYIGDDGGSEGLAYDTRSARAPLVLVQYSSPGWPSGFYQAPDFTTFLSAFAERGWDFEAPYVPG